MKLLALILAAGQSRRFDDIKQLADIDGQPMICRCIQQYYEQQQLIAGIRQLWVVLGANAQKISAVLPAGTHTIVSPNWQSGMGSSLSDAIGSVPSDISHVLVGLGDQIAVGKLGIERLIAASESYPDKIIASQYREQVGAPVIFPREYFPRLALLAGDRGAKAILCDEIDNTYQVSLPEAALDIDTPQDLEVYLNS